MKQSHICPKCNSHDVIRVPGEVGAYGTGNNIQIGMTTFSAIEVTRYVCGHCGYSEEWIDNPEDLEKLKEKYGTYSR
jgi:ribosomal protein S27AE